MRDPRLRRSVPTLLAFVLLVLMAACGDLSEGHLPEPPTTDSPLPSDDPAPETPTDDPPAEPPGDEPPDEEPDPEPPVDDPPPEEPGDDPDPTVPEPWLDDAFTVVVLPDTQNMLGVKTANNDMVATMTAWIVDNVAERDIAFVTHVGDIVDRGHDPLEWQRAHEQLGALAGSVPYGIALGDHDYEVEEDMGSSTAYYRHYFGPQRYDAYDWYGGSGPDGLSHYQFFESGGRTFLHVTLEWEARGPADDPSTPLGWARAVIEQHAELPTIITTHAYVWDLPGYEGRTWSRSHLEGYVVDEAGRTSYPGSTGQAIFEAVVAPYDNVFMVLNGHYHRGKGSSDGEYHQVSLNDAGSEVYEMLSNFQDYPNGGDGWMRLIEFRPGGGDALPDRIEVATYSPVRDEYQLDAASAFHFDLDFAQRFGDLGATGSGSHHP